MKKIIISVIGIVLIVILMVSCTPAPKTDSAATEAPTVSQTDPLELTLEELKSYNGQNNMPAYIAYEGKIYDVSNIPEWAAGKHNGNTAGIDVTERIKNAPHGNSKIKILTQVGVLK